MTTREVFDLVAAGREHAFYCSAAWHRKRDAVLKRDRYECQLCKARGRYRKAELVHHVNHLKDRPDLALSDTYRDGDGVERRQLISVCKECHETVCHPERMRKKHKRKISNRGALGLTPPLEKNGEFPWGLYSGRSTTFHRIWVARARAGPEAGRR